MIHCLGIIKYIKISRLFKKGVQWIVIRRITIRWKNTKSVNVARLVGVDQEVVMEKEVAKGIVVNQAVRDHEERVDLEVSWA